VAPGVTRFEREDVYLCRQGDRGDIGSPYPIRTLSTVALYDPDRERPNAVRDLLAKTERGATKS
jgi:hypothetical protein